MKAFITIAVYVIILIIAGYMVNAESIYINVFGIKIKIVYRRRKHKQ